MSLEPFEMIDWHLKTLLHAAMLPMAVALRIAALTKYCIAFALCRATPARNRTSCDAIYGSAFPDAAALIALVICDRVESR
jgi:F0F1-type ATP synthase membrane subunit c/vacuolar-type H+-ATPase subunit K